MIRKAVKYLIMGIKENLKLKRDEIYSIASRHGARNIRIFGSSVHGEFRADSDIDFLVDLDSDRSLFDLGELLLELQELLGRKVDVVTEDSIYWLLKRRILKEAVPL
jgi:predicted nucleotidyltransferase